MRPKPRSILAALVILCTGVQGVMAIEEAPYTVVKTAGAFEVRDYAPHIVAETRVESDLEGAGSQAFRTLFRYISGANRAGEKIAMTAPVAQSRAEKIAMTAPVGQQRAGDRWVVSFMMPESSTLATLPLPEDPQVSLREVPARRMAAVRYSGFWSEENYREHLTKLLAWLQEQGLEAVGEPVWARYNAPFVPWFMRRNEVLIPVAD